LLTKSRMIFVAFSLRVRRSGYLALSVFEALHEERCLHK